MNADAFMEITRTPEPRFDDQDYICPICDTDSRIGTHRLVSLPATGQDGHYEPSKYYCLPEPDYDAAHDGRADEIPY